MEQQTQNGHPVGHGHGHEQAAEQPFIPDAHFAVQTQQEEIDRLRTENSSLRDHGIYLRTVIKQIQAEAQLQSGQAAGRIADLETELEATRKKLFAVSDQDAMRAEPEPVEVPNILKGD